MYYDKKPVVHCVFALRNIFLLSSSSKKLLDKIESLRKQALRFLLNDYVSSYEQLLKKSRNRYKLNLNIPTVEKTKLNMV